MARVRAEPFQAGVWSADIELAEATGCAGALATGQFAYARAGHTAARRLQPVGPFTSTCLDPPLPGALA